MLLKNRKYKEIFLELALLGFILSMPFSISINSIFLILSGVAWLISGHALTDLRDILKVRLYQLFLFLYFLYVIGIFYSTNTKAAFAEIELKASLVFLPVIFFSRINENQKQSWYLWSFVITCFVASLSSTFLILYKIYFLGLYRQEGQLFNIDWVYFSYHLPKQINFHAPYFSMYMVMGIFIIAYSLTRTTKSEYILRSVAQTLLFLFFIVFTVLLASRTALASGIFILFTGGIIYFLYKKRYSKVLLFIGLSAALFAFLYVNTPYLRRKLEEGAGVSQRQQIWQAGIDLIQENYVFGVGPGDTKEMLVNQYNIMGLETESQLRLGIHNQYIHMFLAFGLFGVITYLACLLFMLNISIRNEVYLLTAFILLYAFCGITESVFNTQKGVIFFTFFSSILAFKREEPLPRN